MTRVVCHWMPVRPTALSLAPVRRAQLGAQAPLPPEPGSTMPIAAESASARLAQELTKKVRDRGLLLWVDADRQYEAFVDALGKKQLGFEYPEAALGSATPEEIEAFVRGPALTCAATSPLAPRRGVHDRCSAFACVSAMRLYRKPPR